MEGIHIRRHDDDNGDADDDGNDVCIEYGVMYRITENELEAENWLQQKENHLN